MVKHAGMSTDEQRKKGYSLIEQEERLLQHCEINNIEVKGIFREDFSAKDFNRPEWTKLIKTIKKNKHKPEENILFIKWDRFSRNIEYAYQMIRLLRTLNVQAMAIDQPIDFEVPESIVMLAVYLSIPEAENSRRGRNTSDGIRRARKMGRWPGKGPIGYSNQTDQDGKKLIVPKQPEASHIKWSFEKFAKGIYSISQVRKMACINGLQCSRNNFWKLLHNPVYCGIITVPANKTEEMEFVKAVHEPLISEKLFYEVQILLKSRRRQNGDKEHLKGLFPLRGFLVCPWCNRRLTGSISRGGSSLKHRYYHCSTPKCKGRFRGDVLDEEYEEQLKKIHLMPETHELFELVLEDENIFSARKEYSNERKTILQEISKQQNFMTRARKSFISDKIDDEDFIDLKKEYSQMLEYLKNKLTNVEEQLINSSYSRMWLQNDCNIFQLYKNQDTAGKRYIINLLSPTSINPFSHTLGPLRLNNALAKILSHQ